MVGKYSYIKIKEIFCMGTTNGEKSKQKKLLDLIHFSKTTLLEHILRKNSTFTFWCMVIPLDPHSVVTPNEKPTDFVK